MTEGLESDLQADDRFERALFWRELLIAAVVAIVIVLRLMVG